MPSDANADGQLYAYLVHKPLFRRVRVSEGKSWTPDRTFDPDQRDTGLYCKDCGKFIRYRDLDITYEMRTDIMRLWWCGYCDTMVREDNMSDLAMVYELRNEEWWCQGK